MTSCSGLNLGQKRSSGYQEKMKLFILAGTASAGLGDGQWRALADFQVCADELGQGY